MYIMIQPGNAPVPPREQIPHSSKTLADIWVASYKFSQGGMGLQQHMVKYVCTSVLAGDVRQEPELLAESFDLAMERVHRIVNSEAHAGPGFSHERIERDFQNNVINPVESADRGSLSEVVRLMLKRDAHYLPANHPKHARTFGAADGTYFSYVSRYLLMQKRTKSRAINVMLARARDILKPISEAPIITHTILDEVAAIEDKKFTFGDIVAAHIKHNPKEAALARKALEKLGIEEPTAGALV